MLYRIFVISCLFLLPACSLPQHHYYSDDTYLYRLRVNENYAQQLKSPSSNLKALSDSGASPEIILFKNATEDEEERQGYTTGLLKTAALERLVNKYDVWLPYPPSSTKSLAVNKNSQPEKMIPLGKAWQRAYEIAQNLQADKLLSFGATDVELTAFEPNLTLELAEEEKSEPHLSEKSGSNSEQLNVIKAASEVWGYGEPGWHFSDKYSQLDVARETLAKTKIGKDKRVLIAHLDTGYNSKDATLLVNRDGTKDWPFGMFSIEESKGFTGKKCKNYEKEALKPGECPSHGTKTLSVLSGKNYRFSFDDKEYRGIMGANPYANAFEYRISNSVVHLSTKAMTAAINAAVEKKADVISLSAGGFPSRAQRDAVNHAYDNGTAIFAATGDFFKLPFLSFKGFDRTPSLAGFPARYSTVMAVAGTTYDYNSYGEDPYSAWAGIFKNGFSFAKWGSWMLRGNFGPEHVMAPNKAVAGYAPNILRSEPPKKASDSLIDNQATLDGAGTSHAVPQVAGAASIWLQQERDRIEAKGLWDKWQKTEAVYQAVSVCSADKTTKPKHMSNAEFQEHFGAGHLKARQALEYHFPEDPAKLGAKRPEATIGYTWIYDLIMSMRTSGTPVIPLEKLHASMMLLEILQFATIDKGLADAKRAFEQCLFNHTDKAASSCKEQAVDFLTNIGKYPEFSEKLRGTLDKLLASTDKLSDIDKYLKTELDAFRQAMKDTDPNRCRLEI